MWRRNLEVHFESFEKQAHAARLGMWVFIGSELLFFGGLFGLYASYRVMYPDGFREASRYTDLVLGTINTFVLLTSSLTVALSLSVARQERAAASAGLLGASILLALMFLVIKGLEYGHHVAEGIYPGAYYRFEELPAQGAKIFFTLYYFMTGLHALHVVGGVGVLAWLAWLAWLERVGPDYDTPLELGAMYWHFVDIIWIFLWPLFYLIR